MLPAWLFGQESCFGSPTGSQLSPRQISTLSCIHADLLTFIDKRWHLHDESRFELCRLSHAACRSALQSRFRLNDSQLHRLWQFNTDRLVVVELNLDLQIRRQVLHGIAERVAL